MRRLAAAALFIVTACSSGSTSSTVQTEKAAGASCSATSQCSGSLICAQGVCAAINPASSCPAPPGSPTLVAAPPPAASTEPTTCVSTVSSPDFGAATDLDVQDLGTVHVNATVQFVVTAGTTSFSLVSQEVNGSAVDEVFLSYYGYYPNSVEPDQVKTPSGSVYYEDYDDGALNYDGSFTPDAVYLSFTPVSGTFTAPNTSAGLDAVRSTGELPPGTWTFRANDWANDCVNYGACTAAADTGNYHLYAVTKQDPIASTGTLDVDVYLLTDPGNAISTAAAAVANPQMTRWVESLGQILGNAGICLGTVTVHDLPAWVHDLYPNGQVDISNDGPCDPLAQLFTTSTQSSSRSVHVFFIEELLDPSVDTSQETIVGLDGSIPGPSGFPGTIWSGAAVGLFGEFGYGTCSGALSLANCGTDQIAYIAAHEIGHWLGLYHTTESNGVLFDPLTDTAECACQACGHYSATTCNNGDGKVTASQCVSGSCGGGDDLMFWILDPPYSKGTLSRDQGQVMRLNPAVR